MAYSPATGGGVSAHGDLSGRSGADCHPIGAVTGLQAALDGKAASNVVTTHEAANDPHSGYRLESEKGEANGYASLDEDGKVPAAQLPAGQAGAAWGGITGTLADQTDLQAALDAKSEFSGSYTDLTDKPTIPAATSELVNDSGFITSAPVASVAGKTGVVTLVKADVGLANVDNTSDAAKPVSTAQQTALDAKQATSAKDAASGYCGLDGNARVNYARMQNVSATARILARITASAGVIEEATLSQILDLVGSAANGDILMRSGGSWTRLGAGTNGHVLTLASGVPSWAAAGGGADPWTVLEVNGGSDFTTSSATAVDVTGLAFTPAANTRYMFEAVLGIRTATATVNPRVGLAWATGMFDGVAQIDESQTATTRLTANGNINAALLMAVGGIPNTNQSWPVTVWGWVRAGATPSGNVRIQLASETAGTVVRVTAHSYLRYRTY